MAQRDKRLLIFDLDGTLIDSVPDLADAVNSMLATLGKARYPVETVRHWVGNGSRVLMQRALVGDSAIETAENKAKLAAADIGHAEQLFFSAYEATRHRKTLAYPGVSQGLWQLQANGFVLALATNKPGRFLPAILSAFAWEDLFAQVVGGDSLARKKPDPAPLLHICSALDIPPQQAIMIGDSRNDILAGRNAGMDTLGLSYGYNYGQDIRDYQPTAAFDDFPALVEYILQTGDKSSRFPPISR